VQALAESCGLNLAFETDGRKLHVVANPTALRQVLLNLLTNAIKFTPRGGHVGVRTGYAGEGQAFLVVRDTGCGMAGSTAPIVSPASEGDIKLQWARSHGIGLPLVATLVRDMGAEIRFESSPQTGTVATIVFSDFSQRFK
jgi:signal transduction histidine kinase